MGTSNLLQDIQGGKRADISLAASVNSDWLAWDVSGGSLSIRVTFHVADAEGTLGVQSYPGQAVAFLDENEDPQTTLAVTSALDGLTHEFVISAPCGRYRVTYTRASGGAADTIDVAWS